MSCELHHINKSFHQQVIFEQLSLTIDSCGLYAIYGESGSGKTTLLNILAGYEPFESGERLLSKEDHIACIFQTYELLPSLTVRENILLSARLHEDQEIEECYIDELGLTTLLDHYPHECSQGQKQRIGIARALLMNPNIILCDEPTESLDQENKEIVMRVLSKLSKEKAVIIATHGTSLIEQYHPRIFELQNHSIKEKTTLEKGQPLSSSCQNKSISKKALARVLHQITYKKDRIQLCLWLISSFLCLLLFQFYDYIFTYEERKDMLNYTEVYATLPLSYQEYTASSSLPFGMEPLVEFDQVRYMGRRYAVHILPIPNTEDGTTIHKPLNHMEVIINQNTARLLQEATNEDILGKELNCTITLDHITYDIPFVIADIIEEQDIEHTAQLYYRFEDIEQFLLTYDDTIPSLYEDAIANSHLYVVHSNEANVESMYDKMKDKFGNDVYHPAFDSKQQFLQEYAAYEMIFFIILMCIILAQIIYILYSSKKLCKEWYPQFAIIVACGVSIKLLQSTYRSIRLSKILKLSLVLIIEIIAYVVWSDAGFLMSTTLFTYCIVNVLFYIISDMIFMNKLHSHQIALILKDDKD